MGPRSSSSTLGAGYGSTDAGCGDDLFGLQTADRIVFRWEGDGIPAGGDGAVPEAWLLGPRVSDVDNNDGRGESLAVVYIPTAPLPNSGWLAVVPVDEVYDTEITPQMAMRFVFSGGIVSPKDVKMTKAPEAKESRRPSTEPE